MYLCDHAYLLIMLSLVCWENNEGRGNKHQNNTEGSEQAEARCSHCPPPRNWCVIVLADRCQSPSSWKCLFFNTDESIQSVKYNNEKFHLTVNLFGGILMNTVCLNRQSQQPVPLLWDGGQGWATMGNI